MAAKELDVFGELAQMNERDTHALEEFDHDFHPDESLDDQDNPTDQHTSYIDGVVQTTVTQDQISNLQAFGGGEMSSFDLACPQDDQCNESLSRTAPTSSLLNSLQADQDSLDVMLGYFQHISPSAAVAAWNQLTSREYASTGPLPNSFIKPQAGSEGSSSEEESKISGEGFPNTETSIETVSLEGSFEARCKKDKNKHLNLMRTNSDKQLNNTLDEVKPEDENVFSSNSPYSDEGKKCDSYVSNQANTWEHLGARPRDGPPRKDSSLESSSSTADMIPQQVAGALVLGVHNPLLPERPKDKQAGPECCEWMSTDEVGLLSRLSDIETREDISQYHNQIHELREEVARLTKMVELLKEEILALRVQVGRQLFLEGKERRCRKKIFQPLTEDVREQTEPVTTRGLSSDFYDKNGNLHNGAPLVRRTGSLWHRRLQEILNSLSESEFHRLKGLVLPKLDSFRLAKIREGSELFQELESRGELSCTYVRDLLEGIHRFDLAEKLGSSYSSDELSERDSDSLQGKYQWEEEREVFSEADDRNSDELGKTWGSEEKVSLGTYSSETSLNSDDEGAPVTITSGHLNESSSVVSLQLENIASVNQDSLPCGETSTQQHNLSVARNTDQVDRVIDRSDSCVNSSWNEWEHLGARPKDRPPKVDSSAEVSPLDSSLVDLVPHLEPVVGGVANAFLARHAEDKHLCESMYYNNAEEMLAKDSLLPGACYMNDTLNMTNSDQVKQYFGDCQVASRPDPMFNQPCLSLFPLTGSTCDRGNGTSESVESTDNSLLELEQRVEEACAMVERVLREREERKEFGREIERKRHEIQAERLQKKRGREACPEALETLSLHQKERSFRTPTACVVESLAATHYSPQALVQCIRDARMKISARNPQFTRWWCTCPAEHDQNTSLAICTTSSCFKYRYLGPCKVRVQSGHDECCICQVDTSCSLHLLPCSHKGHLLCIVRLIQHNVLHCPSCLRALFPPS